MARFNLYEQQTSAQTPKASADMFGAGVGQAIEQGGNALADIGFRIQRREELAASDALRQELDTWAVPALNDFGKRHDINSPTALKEFQGSLQQKKQELMNKFGGSSESKATLDRELGNQVYQYGKSAIGTKIKAGQEVLARTLNTIIETGTNQVMAAPGAWEDVAAQNQFEVNYRKDGFDAASYQNALKIAIAAPMEAAVRAHLANGDIGAAEAIMKDPRFNEYVGSDQARPLRIQAAVDRGVIAKEQRKLDANTAKWLSVMPKGTTLSVEQAKGLPEFNQVSGAEKIAAHALITGVPATDAQKQIYLGLDRIDKETLLDDIRDAAEKWDTLSPNQQFTARMTAQKYFGVTTRVNDNGYIQQFSNVPNELRERFGMPLDDGAMPTTPRPSGGASGTDTTSPGYNGGSSSAAATEQLTILQQERANPKNSPEDNAALDREIARVQGSAKQSAGQPAGSAAPVRNAADLTVDEMLYDVSGVGGFVGEIAGRTPGVGQSLGVPQRILDYKARVTSSGNQIVALLQQNDKYPEGERKMIAEEVAKVVRVWDNPQSAARNLRSIEMGLEDRQKQAEKMRDDVSQPKDVRQNAMTISAQIKAYRQQLGVIRPKDAKEVKELVDSGQLFPGRNFWTPEGRRVTFTQEAYDKIIGGKK